MKERAFSCSVQLGEFIAFHLANRGRWHIAVFGREESEDVDPRFGVTDVVPPFPLKAARTQIWQYSDLESLQKTI